MSSRGKAPPPARVFLHKISTSRHCATASGTEIREAVMTHRLIRLLPSPFSWLSPSPAPPTLRPGRRNVSISAGRPSIPATIGRGKPFKASFPSTERSYPDRRRRKRHRPNHRTAHRVRHGHSMFFVCYLVIINIFRVSETSTLLTNSMSSLAVVRIGFAALMMLPMSSGFSVGQAFVVQAAGWGIGMADRFIPTSSRQSAPTP